MISAGQNTAFSRNKTLNLGGRLIDLHVPVIMGIINVTPDSFYSGSRIKDETTLLQQAEKMLSEGALILDVGGYSSRPGADDVPVDDERTRVTAAIKIIKKKFPEANISVDTFRSEVAKAAVPEGAVMVNDISGGVLDKEMIKTIANLQIAYICMHMKGTPQTMNSFSNYENITYEVTQYFHQRIAVLQNHGIKDVIVDPGFGFSKTVEHNFELLKHLDHFRFLGKPLMVGLSRKSMIWRTLSITPEEALNGTTALHMVSLLKGASILRVHDVKEASACIKLFQKIGESTTHSNNQSV